MFVLDGPRLTIPGLLPVRVTSASATLECTALRVFKNATNCGESCFNAVTLEEKIVSLPVSATKSKVLPPRFMFIREIVYVGRIGRK
jgi:hypothetical protein